MIDDPDPGQELSSNETTDGPKRMSEGLESESSGSDSAEARRRERREARQMLSQAGEFGYIGIMFGLGAAVGYWIGHWLDEKLGTHPYLTLFFVLCGLAAAAKDLYKMVRRTQRENEQ